MNSEIYFYNLREAKRRYKKSKSKIIKIHFQGEENMRKVLVFTMVCLALFFTGIYMLSNGKVNFRNTSEKFETFEKDESTKDIKDFKSSENSNANNPNSGTSSNAEKEKLEDLYEDIKLAESTKAEEKTELDEQPKEEEIVKMSFAGDVLLASGVESLIEQNGTEFIISDVKEVFKESDISMVNLECAISERGTKAPDKQYTFRAKPKTLEVLKFSKMDVVSLANNHTLDFGVEALLDTFQNLKDYDIKYVGAGTNMDEASRPIFVNEKGIKIAFIASSHVIPVVSWTAGENTPGLAVTYDPKRILEEIASAKEQADIVIVYIHWGQERMETPLEYQKNLARAYIDNGADIVLGSHPHVLQGLEFYKDKVIAYSLGNFIFTDSRKDTMILKVEVNKLGVESVQIVPCRIENLRPIIIRDNNESEQLLKKIESLSFGVEIDIEGFVYAK